jgi:hypothetical protein
MALVTRDPMITEVPGPLEVWFGAVLPNLGFLRTLNLTGVPLAGLIDCFVINVFR